MFRKNIELIYRLSHSQGGQSKAGKAGEVVRAHEDWDWLTRWNGGSNDGDNGLSDPDEIYNRVFTPTNHPNTLTHQSH